VLVPGGGSLFFRQLPANHAKTAKYNLELTAKAHGIPTKLAAAFSYVDSMNRSFSRRPWNISHSGGNLVSHVRGTDKLWALKSSLEILLAHIAEVRADLVARAKDARHPALQPQKALRLPPPTPSLKAV